MNSLLLVGLNRFRFLTATLLLGIVALAGCDSSGPVKLTGQVTYDGQPVEMGAISFEDAEGRTPSAEGAIINGKYEVLDVPRGNKRVKITGQRKTGKSTPAYAGDPNSPMIEETEAYIPAQYNDNTTLTYEVKSSGSKDFALTK